LTGISSVDEIRIPYRVANAFCRLPPTLILKRKCTVADAARLRFGTVQDGTAYRRTGKWRFAGGTSLLTSMILRTALNISGVGHGTQIY
jgi:hypothetical protein